MKRKNREAIAGKNIIVDRLYRCFVTAKAIAGLADHDYTLKDLRPKGITDEVTNNLARIRWEK